MLNSKGKKRHSWRIPTVAVWNHCFMLLLVNTTLEASACSVHLLIIFPPTPSFFMVAQSALCETLVKRFLEIDDHMVKLPLVLHSVCIVTILEQTEL